MPRGDRRSPIAVGLTPRERQAVETAAKRANAPVAFWVRQLALDAAGYKPIMEDTSNA